MGHVLYAIEDGLHVCQNNKRKQSWKFQTCVHSVEWCDKLLMMKGLDSWNFFTIMGPKKIQHLIELLNHLQEFVLACLSKVIFYPCHYLNLKIYIIFLHSMRWANIHWKGSMFFPNMLDFVVVVHNKLSLCSDKVSNQHVSQVFHVFSNPGNISFCPICFALIYVSMIGQ